MSFWRCALTDNELIAAFIPEISSRMTTYGVPVIIRQSFQPVGQGAETLPTIYLFKIGDKRIGQPTRVNTYNTGLAQMVDDDVQLVESTFQFTGLVRQTDASAATASDVVNIAAMIVGGAEFINAMRLVGAGVLKVGEVRNPYFTDERNQNAASPSFDLTLVYNRTLTRNGKVLSSINFNGMKGV